MKSVRLLAPLALFAALGAACGGGASVSPSVAGAMRIDVSLTDALRIEPAQMTVAAGQPITFAVTNTGSVDHEFFVGDEEAQAEHEREMASTGGAMTHDDPTGVAVQPGQTEELTITFDSPGQTIAGCHLPGHYPGGMRATITITP